MSRDIKACPECDYHQLYHRTGKPTGSPKDAKEWRCEGCGATFDSPNVRPRRGGCGE